ncbi:VENN motif pre-toxin domain-containing protein [Mannheimia granulomatis]|nr:VENN motif pre-toxin domain-containing protein [Mannheimia granulomatis]
MATAAVGAALSALGNQQESEGSQTQAVISSNINLTITDSEKQKALTGKTAEETLQSLNRDTENANQAVKKADLVAIQEKQETAQVIGELSQSWTSRLVQPHLDEANKKRQEAKEIEKSNPEKSAQLKAEAKAIEAEYGLGSNLQMGIRAATAALQGLATGNANQAAVGLLSPYANKLIKEQTTNADGSINTEANLMAHAVLGAVEAHFTGNNAAAGAVGAFTAEAAAPYLMQALYNTDKPADLTETQKQNIANLSQIAAGLAGGVTGDGTADLISGAEIGKRAVENNYLFRHEAEEKMILERKVQRGEATEDEQQRLAQINLIDKVRDLDIKDACQFVSSAACRELVTKAEYAQYSYEQNLSYNTKFKDLYPNDYQNVLAILKGKDKESVEFEKTAISISKTQKISIDEAKNFLGNVMLYKEIADLAGMVRGGTAAKYAKPMKTVTPPVGYEKVTFNGIELHPDLPPPKAGYDFEPKKAKGNTIYQEWKDINGYRGEIILANNVASTGRTVVKWGNSTGTNGSDIISVNPRTGEVELWDNKYRSGSTSGKISPTFDNEGTRANAIREARREIESSALLSPEIQQKALENLRKRNFTTYTVGSGKVKNSVIQKYCDNQKCP